jgi:hypothetical protein
MANINTNLVTKEAVIASVNSYGSDMVFNPFIGMMASLLVQPDMFNFPEFGAGIYLRSVKGGKAATYDEADGWKAAGTSGTVEQTLFSAVHDRYFPMSVGWKTEANSIYNGWGLSGAAIMKQNWNEFGAEVDSLAISSLYAKAIADNKILNTATGFKTVAGETIKTLNNIKQRMFKNGVAMNKKVAVFIRDDVYTTFQNDIVANYGLASGVMLKPTTIPASALPKELNVDNAFSVEIAVTEFNGMYLINMPSDRMYSLYNELDGKSAGQEAGGITPDTTSAGTCQIDILAVALEAASIAVRHIVNTVSVPLVALGKNTDFTGVGESLSKLLGGVTSIENIGVNQHGDRFEYNTRIIYGTAVMPYHEKQIIAVTGALHA